MEYLDEWIYEIFGKGQMGKAMILIETFLIIIILAMILYFLSKIVLKKIANKSKLKNTKFAAKCLSIRKAPLKLALLAGFFLADSFSYRLFGLVKSVAFLSKYAVIIMLMIIIGTIIDIVNDIYTTKEISKRRPIKGPLQIVKVLIFIVMGIIMISILLDQNPIVLISGIGTFTAILSIVFKDALLGLVAGVQITSDDLLQIDDWVIIPSLGVEGSVKDISLVTVKIKAFDNTIVSVPAYTFMSVPFRNMHHTILNAERQVHKVLSVDVNSIRKVDEFEAGEIIRKYKNAFEDHPIEGGLTNLYYYRTYLLSKLSADPHIKQDFSIVCKTNEAIGNGAVVEIFATSDVADYDEFVNYSSQILEMAISSLKSFDLKPYQSMVSK